MTVVLEHHRDEHEALANRWRKEATKRAEVIVKASLIAGREAMAKGMNEGAEKVLELIRQDTREDLRAVLAQHQAGMQRTIDDFKKYVRYVLGGIAAGILGAGVLLILH